MNIINITTHYITLGQFLKFVGIVENGAKSKLFLENNTVKVNENSENRRGRKLYNGDVILIGQEKYQIRSSDDVSS